MPEVLVRPSSRSGNPLNPLPPYPLPSLHVREAGRVIVRVLIGPKGRPMDVVLQRSSGFARLDQASLETVKTWRFEPAAHPGPGNIRWVYIPINFVPE
jgi:protein TonB